MDTGLALSAVSAVALGVNALLFAVAARRIGTVPATAVTLVLALGLLVATALAAGAELRLEARSTTTLLVAGTIVAVAYLAAIESLRRGPVAITATIASSAGAATVVAAFLLLGERPNALQWTAVVISTVGVVLASARFDGGRPRLVGLGPLFGIVALLLGAVANALVRDPIRELGPLDAIVTQRTFTVLALAVLTVVIVGSGSPAARWFDPRRTVQRHWTPRLVVVMLLLALADALAFVAFAYALVDTPAWLVGLVSQSGRVLAVVGAIWLFRERPTRAQWCGIATLGLGLVILAVASR